MAKRDRRKRGRSGGSNRAENGLRYIEIGGNTAAANTGSGV